MLGGLQLAWIIKDWFALSDIEGAILDDENLFAVKHENNNLEGFIHNPETALTGLKNHPEHELFESILLKRWEKEALA